MLSYLLGKGKYMKKSEMAQKLVYLISDNHDIMPPEEQFPHPSLSIRRKQAYSILDGLVELGMLPPEQINFLGLPCGREWDKE